MSNAPAANAPVFNERGLLDPLTPPEADIQRSLMQPSGQSFSDWMESRVARRSTRSYDWDALKFQADYDPRYRRAQMRYVGTGGTGVSRDSNAVPSAHFTFSTMVIPAGNIGPSHIHYDVEEIFFVLRGVMKVICEKDGQRWEAVLGERDLISVPPGVYREEQNIGDEDALMCVMLGSPKPITPVYPPIRRSPKSSAIWDDEHRTRPCSNSRHHHGGRAGCAFSRGLRRTRRFRRDFDPQHADSRRVSSPSADSFHLSPRRGWCVQHGRCLCTRHGRIRCLRHQHRHR